MLSIWLEVAAEVKERRRANTAHRNLRPPSSTARQQSSVEAWLQRRASATRKFVLFPIRRIYIYTYIYILYCSMIITSVL